MSEKHLSTTALARQLRKESKELFILLAQGGWIVKVDNHWQLTEKGKFEGGIYINHPKYGEYIAWPEAIQDHPLLRLLPEAPLSATHLGAKVDLPARLINVVLAERGWIKKHIRGWLLTSRGKAIGGEQHTSEQSGIPFVTWPETLLDNSQFLTSIAQIKGEIFSPSTRTLSGRLAATQTIFMVENWLYLAGVHHASPYLLSAANETVTADFFLPEFQLAIDIWGADDNAAALSDKLIKQEFYKKYGYDFIELREESMTQLDEVLAKQLFQFGLAVY
ncbi:MAG: 4-alpha-glucanotransferase [Gammaproteobacteria bacterium]|nr:MAG: 4-alpha-glucanotransferase [Gammaproteobacteria bacterium]